MLKFCPDWLIDPRPILPGLATCGLLALVSFGLQKLSESLFNFVLFEALVIALILGMALRHFIGVRSEKILPGAQFAAKELLEFAIVILGCSVDLKLIFKSGPLLIGMTGVLIVAVITLSSYLGQKLGLNRSAALLVGVGNGICGNSAISAVAPLIDAKPADVATAISFTAIASVLVVLLLPLLPKVIPLSTTQYGVVAGLTVYAVPQVLAAAYPVSAESVAMATLVKLTRVLFLSPVVMFFALFSGTKGARGALSIKKLLPWFLLGFFIFAGLRSMGLINAVWAETLRDIGKILTMLAMGGIGLSVDFRALKGTSQRVILTVAATLTFMMIFAICFAKTAFSSELLLEHNDRPLQAEASMAALEPWETPIAGFFVRSHFGVPFTNERSWTLVIDGLVDTPLKITLADIKKLETRSLHSVLECSGNGRGLQVPGVPGVQWRRGAVGNAEWTGVAVADLLKQVKIKPEARFARLEGLDKPAKASVPGFVRSIPLDKLLKDDTLLAWAMNREAMPTLHGGPLRLILPDWYGENWIKWIHHISLSAEEDHGFYMKKAYRMPKTAVKPGEAWDSATGVAIEQILVQSLIVNPISGATVPSRPLDIKGKAFSGAGAITKVEISLDEGKTWTAAQVEARHPSGGWQEFTHTVLAVSGPALRIWSRATDVTGAVQPLTHVWNPPGYLRNAVDGVDLTVANEASADGAAVVEARCLGCHGRSLIESQNLSEGQWQKVITKMKTFGAELNTAEEDRLVKYLAQNPRSKHVAAVNYERKLAEQVPGIPKTAKAARGHTLFATNCAACHGPSGEGGLGPRLINNALSPNEFSLTVRYGKRVMPAFGSLISESDQTEIQAFLHSALTHTHLR